MTDSPSNESDRRRIGQELRQIAARLGLDSDQKIADQIEMNRGMVARVLKGDATVSPRKWEAVETLIRELDHEMSSEHDEITAITNPHRVTVRYSRSPGVEFMVEGDVSDLAELEDSIIRLVKRMESEDKGPRS